MLADLRITIYKALISVHNVLIITTSPSVLIQYNKDNYSFINTN